MPERGLLGWLLLFSPVSVCAGVWHKAAYTLHTGGQSSGSSSWEERVYGRREVERAHAKPTDSSTAHGPETGTADGGYRLEHTPSGRAQNVLSATTLLAEKAKTAKILNRKRTHMQTGVDLDSLITPAALAPDNANSTQVRLVTDPRRRCRIASRPIPDPLDHCAVRPEWAPQDPHHFEGSGEESGSDASGPRAGARRGSSSGRRAAFCRAECVEFAWVFVNSYSTRTSHMPSIAALSDGTLIVAFQAARYNEGDTDQQIMVAVSKDGGRIWSPARPLFQETRTSRALDLGAQWGPVLARSAGSDVLRLWYSQSYMCRLLGRQEAWSPGGDIVLVTSTDGRRWSPPRHIASQGDGFPLVTANPPVLASYKGKKHWLLPIWRELPRSSNCEYLPNITASAGVLMSYQNADCSLDPSGCECALLYGVEACRQNWLISGNVRHPKTFLIEGALVVFSNSAHVQFFRTIRGTVFRSLSQDGGTHWTEPEPTNLPNPNSKVHALVLSNGLLAMCYNAHTTKSVKDGVRTFLNVAVSPDRGKTWEMVAELEKGQKPEGTDFRPMYHYPAMYQRACTLYVVYTVSFNVAGAVPKLSREAVPEHQKSGIKIARIDISLYTDGVRAGFEDMGASTSDANRTTNPARHP